MRFVCDVSLSTFCFRKQDSLRKQEPSQKNTTGDEKLREQLDGHLSFHSLLKTDSLFLHLDTFHFYSAGNSGRLYCNCSTSASLAIHNKNSPQIVITAIGPAIMIFPPYQPVIWPLACVFSGT